MFLGMQDFDLLKSYHCCPNFTQICPNLFSFAQKNLVEDVAASLVPTALKL